MKSEEADAPEPAPEDAPDAPEAPIDAAMEAAMEAAVGFLTRRRHTENELARKLRGKGFDAASVSAALDRCRRAGYVDDAAAAAQYLEELKGKVYGASRVRQAMRDKGFEKSMTDFIVSEYAGSTAEWAAAERALEKKMAGLRRETDPRKRREKVFRHLQGKGFGGEVIRGVMEKMAEEDC